MRTTRAGNRTSEQIDDAVTGATCNGVNQLLSTQPSGGIYVAGTVSEPATVTVAGLPASVAADNTFSRTVPLLVRRPTRGGGTLRDTMNGVSLGFRFLCAAIFVTSVVGRVAQAQRFDAQLRMQGLTLGKSTLDDVKVRIGDATVLKRGQGGDAVNSICYVPKAGDHAQLIFESGAAGGWSLLTGFRLSTDQVSGLRSNECAISTHLTSPLRLEGGLRLGLSQDEVVKLLGTPTRTRAGSVTYVSQATTQIRASTFDVQTIIRISFQQSKASSIAVLHTVTN